MLLQPNSNYAPSPYPATVSPGVTTWVIVADDGTTYASRALLIAAGKKRYGQFANGGKLSSCLIQSLNSAQTGAGSGVLYKRDPVGGVTPTTVGDADNEVGGSNQQISLQCPFRELWLKNIAASDVIKLDGRY